MTDSFFLQWRAPEEYRDVPLNEKIDVFSIGNNIYALLTGMEPFADGSMKSVKEKVKRGQKPHIHELYRTRSYAEQQLAEVVDLCFTHDPDERAEIFEIQRLLRHAVEENERQFKLGVEI
jgi:serine/threonine protein kinase